MQPADAFAGGAEQHRRLGFVEAQQVDHRVLDLGRRHGHRLVGDVAVPAVVADGRDAQRVLLVAPRELGNRPRHRRREQQRAPGLGSRVEDLLEVLAEAHVEHLVGLVEDDRAQCCEVERAALEVVAQAAGGADDDLRPGAQRVPLLRRVHPADACRHPRAGLAVEPDQLAADLQRQLARRRDHQRQRLARGFRHAVRLEQLGRHGHPEGDRLSRAGLRRDDQVAPGGIGFEHGGLHRGGFGIAARGQGFAEHRREVGKGHRG
jgi:hypothetical protein